MDTPQIKFLEAIWVVYGGIGLVIIAISIGLFLLARFFTIKLVDAKIAQKLESFKHAQQVDIEGLKYKINNLSDRASKIYLKEYEHLPNVWISLNEAFRSSLFLAGGLRQYPDLNSASRHDLEMYFDNSNLKDWQKHRIRNASDRNAAYIDLLNRKEYNQAVEDHAQLRQNIDKYAIFFSAEIKREMERFADMLWGAIVEYDVFVLDKIHGVKIERKEREELRRNGRSKLEELEEKIRARLWNADSAAM